MTNDSKQDERVDPGQYSLGELIEALEARDPNEAVAYGFGVPHSYRGYYDELAFEPVPNTTVLSMLAAAREAEDATYQGWKGGDYTMSSYTPVWIAERGDTGETLGRVMLGLMLSGSQP